MFNDKSKKFIEFYNERDYLKNFDKIFETDTLKNIKFDNMKMLKKFYEYFGEELYTPSDKYVEMKKKFITESGKLEQTFSKYQQQTFERCWDLYNEIISEEQQQLFMFGYILALELEKETQSNN